MTGFVFFFFLIVGSMIATATFAYKKWVQAMEAWAAAATALGLQKANSSLQSQASMSGNIRGIDVRVYSERRGSGDDKKTYTVYSAFYLSDAPAVTIKREQGFGLIKRILRTTDVEVGDPTFDAELVVDSADPVAVTEFLTPARRHVVLSLVAQWPTAEVSNSRVLVAKRGLELEADRIVSTVNRLVDTALVLGSPVEVDRALQLESDGELAAGADHLGEINARTDNVFTQLLEATARTTLGDRDHADRILAMVEEQMPADQEVMELRDMIARPAPPAPLAQATALIDRRQPEPIPTEPTPEPMSTPEPPFEPTAEMSEPEPRIEPTPEPAPPPEAAPAPSAEPASTAAATEVDIEALIADLFGSGLMGHEVETRFLDVYHGRPVRWSGPVEQIRPYRGDRDFGSDEGQKAKVLVGNIGDGRLVTSRVEAVVQLSVDAPVERGDEITFTGTLLRIDRLMRNIYVADGMIAT